MGIILDRKDKGFVVVCVGVVLIIGGLILREAVTYREVEIPYYESGYGYGFWTTITSEIAVKGAYEDQAWVLIGFGVATILGGIYVGWVKKVTKRA